MRWMVPLLICVLLPGCGFRSAGSSVDPATDGGVRDTAFADGGGTDQTDVRRSDAQWATDVGRDASRGDDADDAAVDDGRSDAVDSFLMLDECLVTIEEAFSLARIDPPGADSEEYVVPDPAAVSALEVAVRAVIAQDYQQALQRSAEAGYVVCRGTGDHRGSVLFEPAGRGTGHAVLAIRLHDEMAVPAMFQAPHIIHDTNTLPQAWAVFEATRARALLASGTHRCASSVLGCSGSSTSCNRPDESYTESDMAHSVTSFFQAAHVAVAQSWPQDFVISLHGMARAGASVSDGTNDPVDARSLVARVAQALIDKGIMNVTSCNAGTAAVTEEYLCGSTNTQGRHLNGSADACYRGAPTSSGRFLHLEQERSLRDDPALVTAAFVEVFTR